MNFEYWIAGYIFFCFVVALFERKAHTGPMTLIDFLFIMLVAPFAALNMKVKK